MTRLSVVLGLVLTLVATAQASPPMPSLRVRLADAGYYANMLGRNGEALTCHDDTCIIHYTALELPDREGAKPVDFGWTMPVIERLVEGGMYSFAKHRYLDHEWYLEVMCGIISVSPEFFPFLHDPPRLNGQFDSRTTASHTTRGRAPEARPRLCPTSAPVHLGVVYRLPRQGLLRTRLTRVVLGGLKEAADRLARLGVVWMPVHRDRVLRGGARDLVLLADNHQRAVALAGETATVGHHSGHCSFPYRSFPTARTCRQCACAYPLSPPKSSNLQASSPTIHASWPGGI